PTRNIQKMFGRKDEMEVEGLVAAKDDGETAILFHSSKFPIEFGKGRPKEVPVPIPTPCPGQVFLKLLRSATVKLNGNNQETNIRGPVQRPRCFVRAQAAATVAGWNEKGVGKQRGGKWHQNRRPAETNQ